MIRVALRRVAHQIPTDDPPRPNPPTSLTVAPPLRLANTWPGTMPRLAAPNCYSNLLVPTPSALPTLSSAAGYTDSLSTFFVVATRVPELMLGLLLDQWSTISRTAAARPCNGNGRCGAVRSRSCPTKRYMPRTTALLMMYFDIAITLIRWPRRQSRYRRTSCSASLAAIAASSTFRRFPAALSSAETDGRASIRHPRPALGEERLARARLRAPLQAG